MCGDHHWPSRQEHMPQNLATLNEIISKTALQPTCRTVTATRAALMHTYLSSCEAEHMAAACAAQPEHMAAKHVNMHMAATAAAAAAERGEHNMHADNEWHIAEANRITCDRFKKRMVEVADGGLSMHSLPTVPSGKWMDQVDSFWSVESVARRRAGTSELSVLAQTFGARFLIYASAPEGPDCRCLAIDADGAKGISLQDARHAVAATIDIHLGHVGPGKSAEDHYVSGLPAATHATAALATRPATAKKPTEAAQAASQQMKRARPSAKAAVKAEQRSPARKRCRDAGAQVPWDTMYEQLRQYHAKEGHCDVPTTATNTRLANWVSTQRSSYKHMQELTERDSRHGLTTDKVEKLTTLGFHWTGWDRQLTRLRQYVEENGHCNVTRDSAKYGGLCKWLHSQKTGTTKQQQHQLAQLGVTEYYWTLRKRGRNVSYLPESSAAPETAMATEAAAETAAQKETQAATNTAARTKAPARAPAKAAEKWSGARRPARPGRRPGQALGRAGRRLATWRPSPPRPGSPARAAGACSATRARSPRTRGRAPPPIGGANAAEGWCQCQAGDGSRNLRRGASLPPRRPRRSRRRRGRPRPRRRRPPSAAGRTSRLRLLRPRRPRRRRRRPRRRRWRRRRRRLSLLLRGRWSRSSWRRWRRRRKRQEENGDEAAEQQRRQQATAGAAADDGDGGTDEDGAGVGTGCSTRSVGTGVGTGIGTGIRRNAAEQDGKYQGS